VLDSLDRQDATLVTPCDLISRFLGNSKEITQKHLKIGSNTSPISSELLNVTEMQETCPVNHEVWWSPRWVATKPTHQTRDPLSY